eukprot:11940012-Ditylum_brightwellii.AAC.1
MHKEKCNKSHNLDRHTIFSLREPIEPNSSFLSIYQHTWLVRQSGRRQLRQCVHKMAELPPEGWCTSNDYSVQKHKENKKVTMHAAQILLRLVCNVHFAVLDN